jgi:hypothetical protein
MEEAGKEIRTFTVFPKLWGKFWVFNKGNLSPSFSRAPVPFPGNLEVDPTAVQFLKSLIIFLQWNILHQSSKLGLHMPRHVR